MMVEIIQKTLESFLFDGLREKMIESIKKGEFSKRFWLDVFKDCANDEMSTPLINNQLTGGNVIREVLFEMQKVSQIFRD